MKLKNIFLLYKSYYPSAVSHRITIAGCGAMQVSDRRRAARLNISAAPCLCSSLAGNGRTLPPVEPASTGLLRSFCADNRRELFMLGETRSLYGIVYAENLTANLSLMALAGNGAVSDGCDRGLRLTWLFALADRITRRRYSLTSVTLERNGNVFLVAAAPQHTVSVRINAGGKVSLSYDGAYCAVACTDDESLRYARLFCRDNAEWFAAFAAGKEALL